MSSKNDNMAGVRSLLMAWVYKLHREHKHCRRDQTKKLQITKERLYKQNPVPYRSLKSERTCGRFTQFSPFGNECSMNQTSKGKISEISLSQLPIWGFQLLLLISWKLNTLQSVELVQKKQKNQKYPVSTRLADGNKVTTVNRKSFHLTCQTYMGMDYDIRFLCQPRVGPTRTGQMEIG